MNTINWYLLSSLAAGLADSECQHYVNCFWCWRPRSEYVPGWTRCAHPPCPKCRTVSDGAPFTAATCSFIQDAEGTQGATV